MKKQDVHTMHDHQHHDKTHTGYSSESVTHAEHKHDTSAPAGHSAAHGAHHADHTGHEQMFRQRFWANLLLTVPVLLFSPMLQEWLGFSSPNFRAAAGSARPLRWRSFSTAACLF